MGDFYNSKYYSCEEIDKRLLQGTYDDAVKAGFEGTKEEFDEALTKLKSVVTNDQLVGKINEINISVLYPTKGEGGTNKYTLAGAIAQVPAEYRTIVGLKITFINNITSKTETWKYDGGIFTSETVWLRMLNDEEINQLSDIKKVWDNTEKLFTWTSPNQQGLGAFKINHDGTISSHNLGVFKYIKVTAGKTYLLKNIRGNARINKEVNNYQVPYCFYNTIPSSSITTDNVVGEVPLPRYTVGERYYVLVAPEGAEYLATWGFNGGGTQVLIEIKESDVNRIDDAESRLNINDTEIANNKSLAVVGKLSTDVYYIGQLQNNLNTRVEKQNKYICLISENVQGKYIKEIICGIDTQTWSCKGVCSAIVNGNAQNRTFTDIQEHNFSYYSKDKLLHININDIVTSDRQILVLLEFKYGGLRNGYCKINTTEPIYLSEAYSLNSDGTEPELISGENLPSMSIGYADIREDLTIDSITETERVIANSKLGIKNISTYRKTASGINSTDIYMLDQEINDVVCGIQIINPASVGIFIANIAVATKIGNGLYTDLQEIESINLYRVKTGDLYYFKKPIIFGKNQRLVLNGGVQNSYATEVNSNIKYGKKLLSIGDYWYETNRYDNFKVGLLPSFNLIVGNKPKTDLVGYYYKSPVYNKVATIDLELDVDTIFPYCTIEGEDYEPTTDNSYQKPKIMKSKAKIILPDLYDPSKSYPIYFYTHQSGATVEDINGSSMYSAALYLSSIGYICAGIEIPQQFADENGGFGVLSPSGHPLLIRCYQVLYNYLINNFNCKPIVFTGGFSNGGLSGLNIAELSGLPVRACLMNCPSISYYYQNWMSNKPNIGTLYGFTDNNIYEADKVKGWDPYLRWHDNAFYDFKSLGGANTAFQDGKSLSDVTSKRYAPVPVKVITSVGDTVDGIDVAKAFVKAIRNSGSIADIKIYPTQGHGNSVQISKFNCQNIIDIALHETILEHALWYYRFGGNEPKLEVKSMEIQGGDAQVSDESVQLSVKYISDIEGIDVYDRCKNIHWAVDDDSVATIDQNGLLTKVTTGDVLVTVTNKYDNTIVATKTITFIDVTV